MIELWILSFILIAIEAWGSIWFFDIFMKKKEMGRLGGYRYAIMYSTCLILACVSPIGLRVSLAVLASILFCSFCYENEWKQSMFFAGLNYCLLFLMDLFALEMENILFSQNMTYEPKPVLFALPAKMLWICLLFVLRKVWRRKDNYRELSGREWMKLCMMPLFTMIAMLLMLFNYSSDKRIQTVYLFLSVGLITMNFLVVELMQNILDKREWMRVSALTNQKAESELAHYRDMQAVYVRQGKKLHDYKNQLKTIQVLLKEGDTRTAAALAERLTESITLEMSAVNTNHPIVNAVLNQKFHAAREQGVSMIFKVGDMSGLKLDEEETVILLSNLLDNAIHECVKVVQAGRKAVIHIKLVQEDGKLIFAVRNPVAKKIEITEGIGLTNVKAVVSKYDGDFAVFCDSKKFQAVAML